ncbi:MAG: hypothetical protein MUF68_00560 [Cyclobacteriaceae bacterium]|nr:hypothetical protein [Cyclobacteriaceae bacterium]
MKRKVIINLSLIAYDVLFKIFFISLVLVVSCQQEIEEPNNVRSVKIYEVDIPTKGEVNQSIPLLIKAEATNGCYSDFEFSLKKVEDFKYEITATAR